MKISELEHISGVPRSTIHHYINNGLIHKPSKRSQTTADYDHSHVRRLEEIQKIKLNYLKTAKTSRIPIEYIRKKLSENYAVLTSYDQESAVPAKRVNPKAKQKKEDIIEATLKLYAHRGYHLTNIRDITQAVGISSPTFYRYFRDKQELFVETIEYVVKNFREFIRDAIKGETDLALRSKIMFETFHTHYSTIGEILNQLRSGVIVGDSWAKDRLSRLYREMMQDLTREIEVAIKNGIIRPVNPVLLAYFNLAIDEAAIHLVSMDKSYSMDDVMHFVGDMLNTAFLTEKGKKIFNIFYKSKALEDEGL